MKQRYTMTTLFHEVTSKQEVNETNHHNNALRSLPNWHECRRYESTSSIHSTCLWLILSIFVCGHPVGRTCSFILSCSLTTLHITVLYINIPRSYGVRRSAQSQSEIKWHRLSCLSFCWQREANVSKIIEILTRVSLHVGARRQSNAAS